MSLPSRGAIPHGGSRPLGAGGVGHDLDGLRQSKGYPTLPPWPSPALVVPEEGWDGIGWDGLRLEHPRTMPPQRVSPENTIATVVMVGQGWRRMQGSRAMAGTGPSPVVVARGSPSPVGVEAGEGVAQIALAVGQAQAAVPADGSTDQPRFSRAQQTSHSTSARRHSTPMGTTPQRARHHHGHGVLVGTAPH